MKREKFLWPLTQSHHRALWAAKRVKEQLSAPGADQDKDRIKALIEEVQKLHDEELRLHFWDEEKILALYEEHMGKFEPEPERIRKEHRFLEYLMRKADWQSLLAFSEILTAHVRFEEDVLFNRIEKVLAESEKQAVGGLLQRAAAQCTVHSP